MRPGTGHVFVVDDDPSVRRGLTRLLRSGGLNAEAFASAEDFLRRAACDCPCCLVLDVRMPGMTGLELQQRLAQRARIPIVFITAHDDPETRGRAMDAGALDYLTKPFEDEALLDAVHSALAHDASTRKEDR
jgi:FixJ family two-component response regulator